MYMRIYVYVYICICVYVYIVPDNYLERILEKSGFFVPVGRSKCKA